MAAFTFWARLVRRRHGRVERRAVNVDGQPSRAGGPGVCGGRDWAHGDTDGVGGGDLRASGEGAAGPLG